MNITTSLEELQILRDTRSALWAAACHKQITVEELYARLAELRKQAGSALYPDRAIRPKYSR